MSRRGWPCALCWYSQEFPRVGVAVAAAWRSPCPCCSIKFRCHSRYNSRSSLARTHFAKRCGSMIFWFVAKTYVVYVYAWHKIFLSFSNVLTIVKMVIVFLYCVTIPIVLIVTKNKWIGPRNDALIPSFYMIATIFSRPCWRTTKTRTFQYTAHPQRAMYNTELVSVGASVLSTDYRPCAILSENHERIEKYDKFIIDFLTFVTLDSWKEILG